MDVVSSLDGLAYTLKLRMPFGVLGVRESGGRICAIDYLPLRTAELPPQTEAAREAAS